MKNEETIFAEAAGIESAEARAAYLERECGGDSALRREVDGLLAAHQRATGFMESSALGRHVTGSTGSSPTGGPELEAVGATVGPYRLLERMGEGGMGVVYLAEQLRPVRRQVALKIIKPGMDSRQVVARFDAERQALAMMDHPGIARVLDAGSTDAGRPYFAMELVRGVPVTDYCDANSLTPRERLGLFVQVCQAVQHAHTKGVIHRDLKPTNILVTLQDGEPVPKVIDFGIAKATGGAARRLTEGTLFTTSAQMIGTPLYMSPEQAEFSGLDVDTRSDIYSLGVLLYELLTGTTPFDKKRLGEAALDEVRRIIREEEPPRPSTRLATLPGVTLAVVSANRKTNPAKLGHSMRGELDWIVTKCLEKDRARRYETADRVAADVQRYLKDEAVEACPPSTWYRFRKLAKRKRGPLLTATAALVAVLLGMVALGTSNYRVRREQTRTSNEKDRAERAQQLAEDRADEVRQGLERLKASNAALDRGRWFFEVRRWDDADAAFSRAVRLRPDHAAAWRQRGEMYALLGLWDLAGADFSREFELRDPDATMPWYRHAVLRLHLGDTDGYRRARARMRERFQGTFEEHYVLELVRTVVLDSEPDKDIDPLVGLAARAAGSRPGMWFCFYVLGIAEYRAGHYEQAVRRLKESLSGSPVESPRALSYPVLAMAHHRRGETAEARKALDSAAATIESWTQLMYQEAVGSRWVLHRGAVAVWPVAWWDWLECRLYYREAKLLIDGVAPPNDSRLQVLRARGFAGLRRDSTAGVEYAAALRHRPDDPQIRLEFHRSAGFTATAHRQWSAAAAHFDEAIEGAPDDANLLQCRAVAQLLAGDEAGYRRSCLAALEQFEKTADPRFAGDLVFFCVLRPEAVPDAGRLLALAKVASPLYSDGLDLLGAALYRAGRYEECLEVFRVAERTYRPRAWDWSFRAMADHRLGHADEARRCLAEAARWIDQANGQAEDDINGTRPAWGHWHERFLYPLLLREAQDLVEGVPHRGPRG
ncbi:MAG TPA: protein kinase, partial [Tepidisphaeraceae bacterium]|nr:protein kinase [Tepidisphaeraceae bacterium]